MVEQLLLFPDLVIDLISETKINQQNFLFCFGGSPSSDEPKEACLANGM